MFAILKHQLHAYSLRNEISVKMEFDRIARNSTSPGLCVAANFSSYTDRVDDLEPSASRREATGNYAMFGFSQNTSNNGGPLATHSGPLAKPWDLLKQPFHAVVLLSIAYLVVVLVGVVNNTLVIAVVFRQPKMRTITNYFLVNLATADILVCVVVLPITLLQNVFTEWWYGPVLCKVAPYLQGVAVSASVNTLAAVAVERYLVIFYPRTPKMTVKTAALVICAIWLVPLLLFVPWIVIYREKVYKIGRGPQFDYVACHADWSSDELNKAFTLGVVFITCYLIPLTFIAIFYLLIGVKVWKRRVRGMCGSRAEASIQRSKTRILSMLAVVFILFSFSWLPLYCINLRVLFGGKLGDDEKTALKNYLIPLAQWLGSANSCVNPFIYCYFSLNFRSGVHEALLRCRRRGYTRGR